MFRVRALCAVGFVCSSCARLPCEQRAAPNRHFAALCSGLLIGSPARAAVFQQRGSAASLHDRSNGSVRGRVRPTGGGWMGGAVERRYMARFSACNASRFCATLLTNGDVVVRGRGLAVPLWSAWCTVRDAKRSGRVGKWWWGVTGWKSRGRARWLRTAGAQRAALT